METYFSFDSHTAQSQLIKILVIDDNLNDYIITKKYLSQIASFNAEVDWIDDSSKILPHLNNNANYDIILIDYYLNDQTALDVLNKFKAQKINIPSIIITNLWDRNIDMELIRTGAADYLVKTEITPSLLERSIRYAIERQNLHNTLDKLSQIDPLTGFLNVSGLQQTLNIEIETSKRRGTYPVVLLIDLDNFREINETFGRSVGDIVLKEMSKNIKKCLRQSDYAARISGDDFLIVLPDTRLAEGAMIAERIRLCLAQSPIELTTDTITLSASIGFTGINENTHSIDSLFLTLRQALTRSKIAGKNKVSSLDKSNQSNNEIIRILRDLQNGHGIYSVSQPIVELKNRKLAGYEMLSRGTDQSFQTPDDIFRLSMEHNILNNVDLNCIKKSLEKINELDRKQSIHLNILPSTIISSFCDSLIDLLVNCQKNHSICLEISEQQLIGDPSYLKEPLLKFKQAGISVSIDDVGFGKSSLESLVFLDPDIIKIDKNCVMNVSQDKVKYGYLKRLVTVANSLEMGIIAEGIETEEDLNVLIDLGICYGQGYYFAKPSKDFAAQSVITK